MNSKTKQLAAALTLAVGAAVPLAMIAAPAPAVAAAGDLDKAVAALRGISTMKANFTQTDRSGQTMAGQLTLKRPGKIRFDYGKSAPMLVVSNGRSLYLVDYDVKQVERWPISSSPLITKWRARLSKNRAPGPRVVGCSQDSKPSPRSRYRIASFNSERKANASGDSEDLKTLSIKASTLSK